MELTLQARGSVHRGWSVVRRLGALSTGMERGTQVTASASWSPVALPVILFYPCFSEIISLWPGLAGCWPQHPCPKNKRPIEGRHFWSQPEGIAGISRQTESWALDPALEALILIKGVCSEEPQGSLPSRCLCSHLSSNFIEC